MPTMVSVKSNRMVGEGPIDAKMRREDFGGRGVQSSAMLFATSEMQSQNESVNFRDTSRNYDEDYIVSKHSIIGDRFYDDASTKDLV